MMSIDEMREHEWYVSWSGGKDSTATIIKMHEHKIPIKEIIYVRMMYDDTLPATLPAMTDFVDEVKKVFESWGYPVTILKSNKTAMDLISITYKRSKKYPERNGHKYGVTTIVRGGCSFSGLKSRTLNSVIPKNAYQMIGYAADETKRLHRLGKFQESILVTLGITEKECFDICRQYNLLSPWYDLGFNRDGCWFCPSVDKKTREYLRENCPDLIEKINQMIEMCDYDLTTIIKSGRNIWVKEYFERNEKKND